MEKQITNCFFPSSATNVLTANPAVAFSADQLQAIQAGTLVLVGTIRGLKGGCINWLRYEGDDKLTYMQIDGIIYGVSGLNKITNLNSFREKLQSAMNFDHRISFCYNSTTDRMSMLNIYPSGFRSKTD